MKRLEEEADLFFEITDSFSVRGPSSLSSSAAFHRLTSTDKRRGCCGQAARVSLPYLRPAFRLLYPLTRRDQRQVATMDQSIPVRRKPASDRVCD